MVGGAGLLGIVGLGAVGGILANIALTPLTAGASLLQSYWYGSGLILGERMMYTVHWEKIKGRLDKGEEFLTVLDKIMNDDITAIANLSFKAMDETGKLYLEKAGTSIASLVETLLSAIITPFPAVDVQTESGTSTPKPTIDPSEELSLIIVQGWSDAKLKLERNNALKGHWSASAKNLIFKEYAKRFGSKPPPPVDIIGNIKTKLFFNADNHRPIHKLHIKHLNSLPTLKKQLLRAGQMWKLNDTNVRKFKRNTSPWTAAVANRNAWVKIINLLNDEITKVTGIKV